MDRVSLAERKYQQLFADSSIPMAETDPEFMAVLQRLIFGEVFHTGDLELPYGGLIWRLLHAKRPHGPATGTARPVPSGGARRIGLPNSRPFRWQPQSRKQQRNADLGDDPLLPLYWLSPRRECDPHD